MAVNIKNNHAQTFPHFFGKPSLDSFLSKPHSMVIILSSYTPRHPTSPFLSKENKQKKTNGTLCHRPGTVLCYAVGVVPSMLNSGAIMFISRQIWGKHKSLHSCSADPETDEVFCVARVVPCPKRNTAPISSSRKGTSTEHTVGTTIWTFRIVAWANIIII